jgi:tyrosyl-tRNA synthetase
MFGKVMSIPDTMIVKYFEFATDVPLETIRTYEQQMASGENPRDVKMKLAYALTELYHGREGAERGQSNFVSVIQGRDKPIDIPELQPSAYDILTVLVEAGFVKSRGEARRDIEGGGVKINDVKVSDIAAMVKPGDVVQKGKRFFVKIR